MRKIARAIFCIVVLALLLQPAIWDGTALNAAEKEQYVCDCGKDCKCGTVANKPGKCVCGMEMKKTGKYICNCGKECRCGTEANKPGKCVCGVEMEKSQ